MRRWDGATAELGAMRLHGKGSSRQGRRSTVEQSSQASHGGQCGTVPEGEVEDDG